jgi:Asparagine synthase
MAFILSFPRENFLANQQTDSRDIALLRVCSEGRDPFEFSTPNVRLVVDRVAHDCRLLHMQSSGEKEIVCVCFGWCGLVDGEGADFDDKTLAYVHAELRANPTRPLNASKRLTGNYLLLVIDLEASRAFVLSDAWAIRCFYYGMTADRVFVSSRAAVIADLIRAPIDGMVWACGLRGAVPPPQATLFHGIHRSLPGQAIVADLTSGLVTLTGSDFFCSAPLSKPFDDIADSLASVVRSSIRRCATRTPLCVDLTGGNDSRLAAAALHAQGLTDRIVFRVTEDTTTDGPLAREIAHRLGAQIISRPRASGEFSPEFFATASLLLDGQATSLGDVYRMSADRTTYNQFDYHMGSLGGELARDFFWSHEYLRFWSYRNVDLGYLLRRRLYASWSDRLFDGIGLSVSQSEHDTYLLDPFRAICARLHGASKFYVLDILYLLRLGRKMANVWCHAPSKTSMLPFLSKEFLEVALRAPWWHRARRRLMLETLWRLDSSLCEVPHDSGATMQPMSLSSCGAHMASLFAEFKRKVLLPGTKPTDDHRAEDAVLSELTHRANELERIGCLPEQGARLNRWLRVDGGQTDRRTHLPALVGLGELLNVYVGIRRDLTFLGQSMDFGADRTMRPGSL